jgi:hypothetical protein
MKERRNEGKKKGRKEVRKEGRLDLYVQSPVLLLELVLAYTYISAGTLPFLHLRQ